MRALIVVLLLAATACSSESKGDLIPPGTYAGSIGADTPFVLEVGDKVKANKTELKPTEKGVFAAERKGFRQTLACKVVDDKVTDEGAEELRCTVTFKAPKGPLLTEVIDLMLL